ncbi:hypothetical protein F2Q69_00046992 [Brassica cretica]|uniref:Uncharacterized protein n=1 Tax=Brassica cretica TaxID=69181 RepID=A0A8S9Q1U8_BRACR|nr:hypothetical protein F2Q69_00046992 [Brassica cretica]
MPPMSSKSRRHRSENPTSANARQIQSVAWSLLMLEDCCPLALIEKANQTSSCRGHERSFHSILFVQVNLSIKTPLHKSYFSLGFKAKEYYSFPSRLISCVMVRLGPDYTTRLIPMRLEVLELSTSRFTVTISESEKFEGRFNGAMPPMSSKSRRHRSENPTSANARQIQSVAWSLLMLEDCCPLALIEKANQTSSCRGHERSFHSILFVQVNLSIKTPLHKSYFSLGFKAKEYYSFPSRLISCVMVRLGPDYTTRLIPMRLEVLELSTSRFTVTISESEKFEGRCIYSMSVPLKSILTSYQT